MRKRCLVTLLMFTLGIAMIGCSKKVQTTEDKGTAVNESKNDSETADPISMDLSVWSPSEDQDPQYGEWLTTMCNRFNEEHPEWDITFKYGVCSESDAKTLVPQDIDAAADVFIYSSSGLENLCQSDCLSQLGGQYLDSIYDNYPRVIVDCLTYEDGGVYGVPMTTNTFYMYYDKSVFSEDDVKSIEAMLQKGKVAIPLTDGFYSSAFYLGAGCTFFGADGKDRKAGIDIGGENAVAVTNYLVDLVSNPNMVVAAPADAIAMMREGKVNAYLCGTWQAEQTKEILGDNFGVAVLPSFTLNGKETPMKPFSSAKAIGVKSTTKYPEAAIELAMYLGGFEGQKLHYKTRSYVPCQNDLLNDAEIQKDEVVMVDAYTIYNVAVPRSNFTEMSYFWSPAESFGTELRDGVITHANAKEKTEAFHVSANSSGVK
ncbi:MAG TPA: extracellular solute-binding protein [Lachnospiraceae bacterium]|nr:extracellular solute-binding protein [Lachnospiraceae bacterium]